ncbi:hypothetical protein QUC32_29630 (plasmid) [Novosphingobium resinovorum]|uniref:hypothetical protein n=1 Tax=Novosphingobium TaxID=165696 RepID=UPI001B3C84FC|nr:MULTISPECIES: hypothetical protein [Novosphingobium]MBF7015141.1 hypothetical protein [Novosphingobium sp. HR1a]WJM29822.1 hypothetical protein QUC32_29630 [Novosphingobium resinovorum]
MHRPVEAIQNRELLDSPTVFIVPQSGRIGGVDEFLKHRDQMRRHIDARLFVLLLEAVPAALRRRLVEKRVAFISPSAQFYVPEAFVDLRETYPSEPGPSSEQVSPTTQVVILAALLGHDVNDASLTQLAERYKVAIMSMSRAFDELEALELARPHRVGRQRRLSLRFDGGDLWRAVEGRLQSPVRKTRYVTGDLPLNEAVLAGESALARYTMLNEPRIECRAAPAAAWKRMARYHRLESAWAYDERRIEVQTWAYDPQVLSEDEVADRLSLYLSARHDADERVAQAADHLLEPFGW